MLLFTYIACLPPGTVAGALFRIEPKLVRAQTYPDGTFLVWQEIIRRILDIPLCTYPLLGNKTPHIEEQSFIYIKRITAWQKNFIPLQAISYKEYMYIFFLAGQSTIFWVSWAAFSYNSGIRPSSKVRGGEIWKKEKGKRKRGGGYCICPFTLSPFFASLLS